MLGIIMMININTKTTNHHQHIPITLIITIVIIDQNHHQHHYEHYHLDHKLSSSAIIISIVNNTTNPIKPNANHAHLIFFLTHLSRHSHCLHQSLTSFLYIVFL